MSVPRKYRKLGDFYKYYSGEATAPVLTIVIGGNHEASNYFFELYYGGWLAPNIYYLGAAGVIRYGPWRIAGLSGIYGKPDYNKPHHERLPYSPADIRSIYHVRRHDVEKLRQIRGLVDVAASHDWPAWVELFGDYNELYRTKPHFLASAKIDNLGSYAATGVMDQIRPSYWFSGHMHCRFEATVKYKAGTLEESVRALPATPQVKSSLPVFQSSKRYLSRSSKEADTTAETKFLALDKYKEGQRSTNFLEVKELDTPPNVDDGVYSAQSDAGKFLLYYDEEWLAITRAYADTLQLKDPSTLVVPPQKNKPPTQASIAKHRSWVRDNITKQGRLRVPDNFAQHGPVYDPNEEHTFDQPQEYPNSQTVQFAELLEMPNRFSLADEAAEVDDDEGDFIVFE